MKNNIVDIRKILANIRETKRILYKSLNSVTTDINNEMTLLESELIKLEEQKHG